MYQLFPFVSRVGSGCILMFPKDNGISTSGLLLSKLSCWQWLTEISKQIYWYKNFCSEIQVGLVALGWLGEATGVSGELLLVFCPSPGVYFPFCCWGLQLGFVLLQQGSEFKQWQLLVELFFFFMCIQDADSFFWEEILQLGLLPLSHQGKMITECCM